MKAVILNKVAGPGVADLKQSEEVYGMNWLAQAREAYARTQQGHLRGKIALGVREETVEAEARRELGRPATPLPAPTDGSR